MGQGGVKVAAASWPWRLGPGSDERSPAMSHTAKNWGVVWRCVWLTFSRGICLVFRELLWFPSFCCSTELMQIPLSASQFLKAICLHIHLPLPTLIRKSFYCFLHIAFSQLLPLSTKQRSKGGYEICILAGLMFSTSVLY